VSEVTIPRIDPSGTFAPVARLKLKNDTPVTFSTGVAKVLPFVVDYIKGDIGRVLDPQVGGSSFAIGPGLYLAQAQMLVSPSQATSIVAQLVVQDNKAGGNFSQQKIQTAINAVQLTCSALLLPTEPPISVPDNVFGEVAMSFTATGANGTVLEAWILLQKLGSVGG
jgi:hypothetical protein